MISEEEFYKRRGDRTRRIAGTDDYTKVTTGITTDNQLASTYAGQVMLITAANLLSRWSRKIEIDIPNVELVNQLRGNIYNSLIDRIQTECKEANPFCDLSFKEVNSDTLTLFIGSEYEKSLSPTYCITADGWDVVGWKPEDYKNIIRYSDTNFVPSAQLASCLGVAQLFKITVGQKEDKLLGSFRWSLWDYSLGSLNRGPNDTPLILQDQKTIGNILQVGIGAVGSNVLYFLSMVSPSAHVEIIDYDKVEVENLDRTLLFGISDASPSQGDKVYRAKKILEKIGLVGVTPFKGSWSEFAEDKLDGNGFDVWLALANENNVWQAMAENLPPLVIQATTNDDWGITLGRHIPFKDYCLRCRFKPDNGNIKTLCSQGDIEIPQKDDESENNRVHASLPFLSASAAALIVSELCKLSYMNYAGLSNYVAANLKFDLSHILTLTKKPKQSCPVCGFQSRSLWEKRNSNTKYSYLSN
ncbi:ThiF family adenylyltransferase [Aliifodinibius sp. S!AR15-10]|uniref:ThiF family adenylyltransferase n=1 Tax=Aliifodinibius sp. S!AR15-10 TaxID=2950437 RepID=UPI002859C662|nr:ThiF family adenylyltransferase [Aliifodinibius sp. S!AR15-10]MDR8389934.1 ThiF family adenylyltransferase [Aliifodinibius sp. S!AR15-10]